ncbi:D-alanine--D-alanine ligase family protein [Streptomyces profundus]|uniref:D-alanine--D-alanine ligase family protein n=1 Tax=Streptomyces profundus TaxID=2867410 RepID=UPI001D16BF26|nr:D-alanine--D-alanine ligase [Streptomyces sp. MA3_2.13]UED86311.1 D-alanine--D-alanine ligase [Streptomyces sp. MA3_2.13]
MATHVPGPGRIAVISGGTSSERERSLLSGRTAHQSLSRQGYHTTLLDAANEDFTHQLLATQPDVALLAIAGQRAEDGKLQGLLELLHIPYTGSGVTASAIGMHKPLAKTLIAAAGIPTLPTIDLTSAIADVLPWPVMLKPRSEGGSIGITLCRNAHQLDAALHTINPADGWFAEPFATGTPVTCGILEINGKPTALPPLETLPTGPGVEFYDYTTKRTPGSYQYRCPATLTPATTETITTAALTAHHAIGCTGYSRSDFVVPPQGPPLWLEINTLPGLSHNGNLATMAAATGIDYDHLIRLILTTAPTSGKYRP